jgi:Domain of unknown function (DUF4279)
MKKSYPSPPSDAPPGTAEQDITETDGQDHGDRVSFGGPVPWFSISLLVTADDLDPGAVTRLLGVEPDEARRRGVPDIRGRMPSAGAWVLRLRGEQTSEKDVGVAISMLLDRIPASAELWGLARANANARVFVGLHLDAFNRGLELSTDLIRRLADLGLRLDLDIYSDEAGESQELKPLFTA